MRHYLDRQVTPPKKATSPILGPLPPCKRALTLLCQTCSSSVGEDRGWNQENRAQELVEERVENGKNSKLPPKMIKFLFSRPQLLIRWIALSTGYIRETDCVTHWIDFYPVDSAIQRLNNQKQVPAVQKMDNTIHWINLHPLNSAIGFPKLIPWIAIYLAPVVQQVDALSTG